MYDTLSIAGYVIGGVGAVAGAVGLALAYKPRASAHAAVTPVIAPNGGGLAVSGSF